MAAINDLIARIQDPDLRQRIEKEVKELTKQKKFGLVFENHIPEMTLLYDYPISRGSKVICKSDDDKKLSEDILWEVKKTSKGKATCVHTVTNEEQTFNISDLICVAKNGEPIYPCLRFVDSVQKAPDSDLWHTLIEADNYHALQLLAYLYPGMVDCIYIDPPYNSGATDWKYNNNYVDGNDGYRHSKWLAMMKSRLLLAKKLLNPDDSVLVVTIDEKDYIHLGCLLEELFVEAEGDKENDYKGRVSIQMISSVIAQSGVARANSFYRTNEFIFIIQLGKSSVQKLVLSDEWQLGKKQSQGAKGIVWNQLRRTGTNSMREDRPNLFYPIIFNQSATCIIDVGESLPITEHPSSVLENKDGRLYLWPIRPDGREGNWQIGQSEFKNRLSKGYIKWGEILQTGIYLTFLKKGSIGKIERNEVEVIGHEPLSGTVIVDSTGYSRSFVPGTQWNIATHDASYKGSQLLNKIIGNRFDFPKSLYAVHDTIRFFVANKPEALILDFFAGSGTTLHAVNLMNKEDGGHRRCIMVTNNEVSADEETDFRARGLHKGDEEWEKYGIARYVNWPRTKCSIEGVDVNGQSVNGDYITSNTQEITQKRAIKQLSFVIPDGRQGINVKKQIVALINDKKMPQNSVTAECPYIVKEDATTAIIFDLRSIDDFFEEVHEDIETIYVVTTNNKAFKAAKRELDELPEITKTIPVTFPMSEGFEANAAFYKLTFLDKEAVSLGSQLDKLLSTLWMKAGAQLGQGTVL